MGTLLLRRRLAAVIGIAALLAPFGAGAAAAEPSLVDDVLAYSGVAVDQLVELPGICGDGPAIEPGIGIDCRFVLRADTDVERITAVTAFVGEAAVSCHRGQDHIICPGLGVDAFDEGTNAVRLVINGVAADDAASITTSWGRNGSVFVGLSRAEEVVFAGRPLRVPTFVYEPVDGVFLRIRARNDPAIVDSLALEVGGPFDEVVNSLTPDLATGRYRAWPCVGASPFSCEELPGGHPFQIVDGTPNELVPGHNRPNAERINVLFVGSSLATPRFGASFEPLPEMATKLLGLDGPVALRFDHSEAGPDEMAAQLRWGPMAIEPLASSTHRFNFWYLTDDIADEVALLTEAGDPRHHLGFDLPNLQVTALYPAGRSSRSDARATSMQGLVDVPDRAAIVFGDVRVAVSPVSFMDAAETLAHEWGHGLFELRDEYDSIDEREVGHGYPNCAPDRATALDWWGDRIGEVDPFLRTVLAERDARLTDSSFGFERPVERTVVLITAGGCLAEQGVASAYRPGQDSLMNGELPVFGPVNRSRVEEVLGRFSGRGPMMSLDDLTLACEGTNGLITCEGELLQHLDAPLSTLSLADVACTFGRPPGDGSGGLGVVPVSCLTAGPAGIEVPLRFRTEERSVLVVNENPVSVPKAAEPRIVTAPLVADPSVSKASGPGQEWLAGGVLLVVGVAGALVAMRSRRG